MMKTCEICASEFYTQRGAEQMTCRLLAGRGVTQTATEGDYSETSPFGLAGVSTPGTFS